MGKVSKKYEDMTVDEKIKKVERRIKVLFREIPKERRQFVDGLIYQFSVTKTEVSTRKSRAQVV